MNFNFDEVISRTGTGALKYDGRKSVFGRENVLPMWVADMDFASPPAVAQALQARARHPIYGYSLCPESLYQSLINWLQARHRWEVPRESILLCPGVVPSINATVMALTKPGDGVIVQPPVYFPFFSAVTASGRTLIENPLRWNGNRFVMDFEHLEQVANAGARLLLLCSPHNPVGRVWDADELDRLLVIAHRHQLTILSDEIHADLVYPGHRHTPLAMRPGAEAHVITAVAPSKTFNIPGLGLSALIVPNHIWRTSLTQTFDMLHVSTSNPFAMTAFETAYDTGAPWLDGLLDYLKGNRDYVIDFSAEKLPQITITPAEGTYLLWLDCRRLGMNDQSLHRFFLDKAGLALSPGTLFGKSGSGYMRMNIGTPRAHVEAALQGLLAAVNSL